MFGGLHVPPPPGHPRDRSESGPPALLEVAREFTPRVEAHDDASVLLDLNGLGRAWATPRALGEGLVAAAHRRRLEPQVALAWTRVAALVIARTQPGLTIVPAGAEPQALAPLPLDVLGLAPDRRDLFHRWGLATLGDLAALPARGLAERLGPEGPRLRRLARGEDERPLVTTPPPESYECALDLDWPVDGLEPLSFLLARVLDPLCESLRARGRRASALTLELRLAGGGTHARTLAPAAPSAQPRTWRTLLLLDLEARSPGDAVTAITVRAQPTPARIVQFSLLDPAQPSPERLAETMARLAEWTTAGRGGSAALVDTHRPGAFAMETFAPRPLPRGAPAPPPARPRLALRVFRPPRPAQVVLRDDAPAFVAAAGVRGPVDACAGPWRASGDWWDVAWSRDEWDVSVAGGLYRLFKDRIRGEWFVAGELD